MTDFYEKNHDVLVIGKGYPNRTSDGRIVQCAIALSGELGLVRFFGNYREGVGSLKVWSESNVTLIRSKKDNRDESYKLVSVNEHKRVISCSNEKRLILNRCVLRSDEDPIELQNRKRLSIALVKPNQSGMILSLENRDPSETEEWFFASQNMPVRAYMSWVSNAGKEHKSHICSHEVMEGLRKNLSNPWDVFNNMKVIERDYEKWLLLGTMANRRSTWLIVHVHRLKKTTGQITKQSSWTEDGRLEGWPYLNKEARFARRVVQERQGYLFTMSDT